MRVEPNSHQESTMPFGQRLVSASTEIDVLADIYKPINNIAIWKRQLDQDLVSSIEALFEQTNALRIEGDVNPDSTYEFMHKKLEGFDSAESLSREATNLVDMFCCLFDRREAGIRLTLLEHAMCPRFHVDKVPCRLVTTYGGSATQWLPHQVVDRSKLGHGNNGLADHESGIYQNEKDIQQLNAGDVALLKGELWDGNENAGLVHRSPALRPEEKRLLLTLDFIG